MDDASPTMPLRFHALGHAGLSFNMMLAFRAQRRSGAVWYLTYAEPSSMIPHIPISFFLFSYFFAERSGMISVSVIIGNFPSGTGV